MNKESDKFLPFDFNELTKEFHLKATKELNETEEKRQKGLKALRKYIKETKHLPLELSDALLLAFLRVAKFDLNKSKARLEKYCALRKSTNLVENLDEKHLQSFLDLKFFGVLPYRNAEGGNIIYGTARDWTPETCGADFYFNCMFALTHFILSFEPTTVSGFSYMADGRIASRYYYAFFTVYKAHYQEWLTVPIRVQRVTLTHMNSVFQTLFTLLRPFLPKKIANRIHFCSESAVEDLHPSSIMPTIFGGTMGPLSNDHFREQFLQFVKKFKEEDRIFKSER